MFSKSDLTHQEGLGIVVIIGTFPCCDYFDAVVGVLFSSGVKSTEWIGWFVKCLYIPLENVYFKLWL